MDNSTYYKKKIEMPYKKEQKIIITTIPIPLERT